MTGDSSTMSSTPSTPLTSRARRVASSTDATPVATRAIRMHVPNASSAESRARIVSPTPRDHVTTVPASTIASANAGMPMNAATREAEREGAIGQPEQREPARVHGVVDPEREREDHEPHDRRGAPRR